MALLALLLLSVVFFSSEASCKRHTTRVLTCIVVCYSVSRPERLGLRICSSCPDLACLAANSSAFLHPSWLVCHAIASAVCQLWMLCLADQNCCGVDIRFRVKLPASTAAASQVSTPKCISRNIHAKMFACICISGNST